MDCPACGSEVVESGLVIPSRRDAAMAVLRDWRIWAIAFAVMLVANLVAGALGVGNEVASAGGGAITGIVVATRMTRYRVCPKCAKIVVPT